MSKALIKITYRQIINASAQSSFEKQVLKASYEEFLLKSQAYNKEGTIKTFSAMKANDGRANSLHYKSGFAVGGYISTLHKKIPGLPDTVGQAVLFDTHRFELIESDITDQSAHTVAIWYYTDTLTLLEHFGDQLLLAYGDKTVELYGTEPQKIDNSFLLQLQPGMSIVQYAQVTEEIKNSIPK